MSANRKLFLSAVSREFKSYRELLAGDLKRPTLDIAVQEDFRVGGGLIEKHGDHHRREELPDAEASEAFR